MFVSLKANKKRIIAFLILVVVIVAACVLLTKGKSGPTKVVSGGTNEERVAYLRSFGWEISDTPVESREVMIPETFNEVYIAYNDMQKAQGFDLKPYAGYVCMQYKYAVSNHPDSNEVIATLLVYDNKILGGDLACSALDGFMHGFAADSAYYGGKKPEKKAAATTPQENTQVNVDAQQTQNEDTATGASTAQTNDETAAPIQSEASEANAQLDATGLTSDFPTD